MNTICPACGSTELKTTTKTISLKDFYGESVDYDERIDCCLVCHECGDFSGENESRIMAAVGVAKKQMVNTLLNDLTVGGIKMTYLERAFELPARTVSRWKTTGECSASSVALLRAVHTYPWLLEVADARFNLQFAQRKVLEAASHILHKALEPHAEHVSTSTFISQSDETVEIGFYARLSSSAVQNFLPIEGPEITIGSSIIDQQIIGANYIGGTWA